VTRVVSGAVLLALAIAAVWLAPPALFVIVAELLLIAACVEYGRLARGVGLSIPLAVSTAAAVLVCASFSPDGVLRLPSPPFAPVLVLAFVVLAVMELVRWRDQQSALGATGAALVPSVYLGVPIGSMVALRHTWGARTLFLLMLPVCASDTAKCYAARACGRRPLAPRISPKKTAEGAVRGFVLGSAVMAILGAWWLPTVAASTRVLLGLAVVALGIAGDLFESMLKRSAGVKDSSALIPGHGGILDRIDALLFAAPVYYFLLQYV